MIAALNRLTRKVPAWSLYIVGSLPVLWLTIQLFTNQLGPDPVKEIEHQLGLQGLQLLIAVLLITPLRDSFGLNLIKFRRAVGVLAFFYILAHLLVWLVLDIQLLWSQIWADIVKRPYITIGMVGFVLLTPLALTSNNLSIRKLGPVKWRRLHKLTYVAVPIGAVHFVMVVKGWQVEPSIYLAVIVALIAYRARRRILNGMRRMGNRVGVDSP